MKKVLAVLIVLFTLNGCMSSSVSSHPGPMSYVEDSVLTAKVKTALLQQKGLEGLAIHVNSSRGVVQLSGFVDSDVNKELAGQIARSVDGVGEVVNNLIVQP